MEEGKKEIMNIFLNIVEDFKENKMVYFVTFFSFFLLGYVSASNLFN